MRLDRVRVILKRIAEEQIEVPEFEPDKARRALLEEKLSNLRSLISLKAGGLLAPGMTTNVVTTLCGVAKCQELSQRFVLEYLLKYQRQDISLIFLSNPVELLEKQRSDNHVLILVGSLNCHESLYIGRSSGAVCTLPFEKIKYIPIRDFFEQQSSDCIIVDPLLNIAVNQGDSYQEIYEYCAKYNITDVFSVRSYHHTPGLKENAAEIKANAILLSEDLKLNKQCFFVVPPRKSEKQEVFFDKYKLPDESENSIEKGLRRAAAGNDLESLRYFLMRVKNVNAQDETPNSKKTALHWAAQKGHEKCYDILIHAGADDSIKDAAGNTARESYDQMNRNGDVAFRLNK